MNKLLVILLFLSLNASARWEYRITTQKAIGFGLVGLGGASYGLRETLIWHYPKFKGVHPNANYQFWYWKQSYKNKYSSNVPFATTAMVWTTDGFTTGHGMEFENDPSSLVNSINAQNGTNFVGARPIRRPK